ncbi:acetoacetate--CoA ligase [Elizabethkingia sp. JS20170427COW]|uniref:acetoacetate--CoA ligase n=1 Tax=Elizabethkingia sp. JS20170427COW TaxID=2583851 RepID=UPI001110216E|nr:acetoacetate--CoA ligase [Elizabethkingia sp. JS20170427COW]QCX52406.1 acetoacetate--CoA ligase [Elizabethkingia sp. JS20170427COW]
MEKHRLLWQPSLDFIKNSQLTQYKQWLKENYHLEFQDYESLWQWSVTETSDFWQSIAEYFQVIFHQQPKIIQSADPMPYTRWFEGATLNYAEHIFRNKTKQFPALIFASERQEPIEISWDEVENKVAALQAYFKKIGIQKGDRIVGYLPNIPYATLAMLAAVSMGAVWSSCSPDFGIDSVLDRFQQIEPKVLLAVDGYFYGGKEFDKIQNVEMISKQLPTLKSIIGIPYLHSDQSFENLEKSITWEEVMDTPAEKLYFEAVEFNHPIWILYSSGTTGIPKAITHSHGGMLLEHLKYLHFHNDVHAGEKFFWYSTTGWMMWNFVQASLLAGATAVLYDGSATYPDFDILWKLTEALPIHHFGTSAPYLLACKKSNLDLKNKYNLSSLRSIGSTGSPLPTEGFDYVYEYIKEDTWLCSMSGGTDICTAWVGGNPWKPVYEGEIQSRSLGCSMFAFDDEGNILENEVGEMMVTKSMPCMPIYFWNDPEKERYKASYFEEYPNVWRHGDWLKINERKGVEILGRSDTTLNRQGIRIGTAEIYRAVDKVDAVKDSLIVNIELPKGGDFMPLFVVLKEGVLLDEALIKEINTQIRKQCSPRHVPDKIVVVEDLPYTISGKKMEAPVKKILMGKPLEKAVNMGSVKNPKSLDFFIGFRF